LHIILYVRINGNVPLAIIDFIIIVIIMVNMFPSEVHLVIGLELQEIKVDFPVGLIGQVQ